MIRNWPKVTDGELSDYSIRESGLSFIGVGQLEDGWFCSRRAGYLHAYVQSGSGETARDGNCGQTQDVEGPGIAQGYDFFGAKILHVAQQIGNCERRHGRGGGNQEIHRLEGLARCAAKLVHLAAGL